MTNRQNDAKAMPYLIPGRTSPGRRLGLIVITIGLLGIATAYAQTNLNDNRSPAQAVQNLDELATPEAQDAAGDDAAAVDAPPATTIIAPKDPTSYGLWVIMPAAVAIAVAILLRQVVPALVIGVLVGAYMMLPVVAPGESLATASGWIRGLRLAAENYVIGAIDEPEGEGQAHLKIMIFTLVIGFTVGVIGRNGGTAGLVQLLTGQSQSQRRTALTTWFAGMVVFFDDYANTMIIGPTMRSVFDRVKLSRAKLAYIVDSTAAPVASIALIGTWVGAEIGYIRDGLRDATANGTPDFLLTGDGTTSISAMTAFIASIPYRYYAILALFFVFLVAITGRDFGPMRRSERNAVESDDTSNTTLHNKHDHSNDAKPCWWLGLLPILVLVIVTLSILAYTGYYSEGVAAKLQGSDSWEEKAAALLSGADAYVSIYYGAIASAVVAVLLTMFTRSCAVRDSVDAGLDGMSRMFPAIVILVLAWALSKVSQDLKLGEIVAGRLQDANFSAYWLPLTIFASSAGISFATGTSWGTMGILCPATVTIAARLIPGTEGISHEMAQQLFFASIGGVLAGSIFGDHCSPISDTTVLSSIASGCRHEEHVWTQMPYALVCAFVAMGVGDVLCSRFHYPWYMGLGAGAIVLIVIIFAFGRKQPSPPSRQSPVASREL